MVQAANVGKKPLSPTSEVKSFSFRKMLYHFIVVSVVNCW